MSGNHRTVAGSRRKPKKNTGLIALAGILVTSLVVVAIAAAVFVLGSSGDKSDAVSSRPTGNSPDDSAEIQTNSPKGGGPAYLIKSTDGFEYSVIALEGGITDGKAYIDYVLTNASDKDALLEEPGDLFVTKSKVGNAARCMPQPGADTTMCSVPNTTSIVGMVGTSKPPVTVDGDKFMPAGAAYRMRVLSDIAISPSATRKDVHLYVWDARFISDRQAHLVMLP
jgi:hypothetical protein